MLEKRKYKIEELRTILNTRDRQGIQRKLTRYGCEFEVSGRGERTEFDILNVPDEFKMFCITELNIPAQSDFRKLKMFYYAFFEDEDFINLPDVEKENYMSDEYEHVSRTTIRSWVGYLDKANLIHKDTTDFTYFAVNHDENGKKTTTEISAETYKQGWREYWKHNIPDESSYAFKKAMEIWGGAVCRTPKIIMNGIEWAKTERLKEIIVNSMLKE
ncbi:MAG: hypothetical protein E7536_07220 [Ruminococcaceae bacterium]|nr:hypothetical protein [Oscillospiraceae bacterium]